jgi:hypothetical protein
VGIGPYLGHRLGARLVQPYAHLIRSYQRLIFLPGPLFALILAAGLAGILIQGRRAPAAVLLWVSAIVTVVLPIAEHEYTYRYVIPAVPLACMAAALAFAARRSATADSQPGGARQAARTGPEPAVRRAAPAVGPAAPPPQPAA